MRNHIFLLVLFSLMWLSLDSGAQVTKPTPEDPSGRWVGQYTLGNQRVFVVIRLKKENGTWVGTYNRPVLDWEDALELRAVTIQGNTISFDLGDASSAVRAETHWDENSVRGKVKSLGTQGTIILEPTATLSKDYMDTLAGDYQTAGGDSYVIERENNYLCFLNRRTGRSGRLMPASETKFWSGPSLDLWYPQEFWFEFLPGEAGQPGRLQINERGKAKIVARLRELYRKEEVEFANAETKLSGTLRIPPGNKPHPAVVILHGSNYQTRGGQYGELAFVADQLARNGFIAFNYYKRGTGKSGGKRDDDPELISGDAASAVRMLRGRPDVDASRIGLWGISQGGIIEPLVAQKVDGLKFFVNVSGAVINTNEQEIQRTELTLRADGFAERDIKDAVHLQQTKFHYACKRDNWEEYQTVLKAAQGKTWLPDPYIGPPDSKDSTAWNFWQCGVEPGKYWENVHVPVLYIQGEFEANSNPRENLHRLEDAMKVAGNTHFEHRLIPGADHSMFKAKRGGEKNLRI